MKKRFLAFIILLLAASCQAQDNQQQQHVSRLIGGPCEGCEAIYEYGDKHLSPVDTLPDFHQAYGPKLKVTGTIYQRDGKTPASGIILYVYHTDQTGVYPTKGNENGWARRHGYLRGWIKTDADGSYTFYTLRPGTYPSRTDPAHIHVTIKEPDKSEYYLDDFQFDDDPLLTSQERASRKNRGGSGIVTLQQEGNLLVAKRDIILGLNIPDYE
jgi:protocatechuate 3,4-dioxygenase beta subunit